MEKVDRRVLALRDRLSGRILRASFDCHLRERIGEGGQGWLFKANWQRPDGELVVVKVLRPDSVGADALRRFRREAEVLRTLSQSARPNPHIVRFLDHALAQIPSPLDGTLVDLPFTVLEFVPGVTFEQVLANARNRGLDGARVRRLMGQVAGALAAVHAQNVIHRDLKPSNILLTRDEMGAEMAKVTDFGLAKLVDMQKLDRTTSLAGASLGYSPPEQYEHGNRRVSPRSDVFSFAAIFYEMLAGKAAFPVKEGENPLLCVTRILNGPRPSLIQTVSSLAEDLRATPQVVARIDEALRRALHPDPNIRPASITELWGELGAAFRSTISLPSTASPNSDPLSPAAWTWSIVHPPLQKGLLKAATFSHEGRTIFGIGLAGLGQWSGSAWGTLALPAEVDAKSLHVVAQSKDGRLLLAGARGLALSIAPGGRHRSWTLDEAATIHGLHEDVSGNLACVGSARDGPSGDEAGFVAQLSDQPTASTRRCPSPLYGVTRVASGLWLACGKSGALVSVRDGSITTKTVCGAKLLSVAALPDGSAVSVGAGGHAIALSPTLDVQLEAVQTTRDLCSLTVSEGGAAWAGSAGGRLLRRTGESWIRMSGGDIGVNGKVLAIWAEERFVRAVCDDGAVIEGQAS